MLHILKFMTWLCVHECMYIENEQRIGCLLFSSSSRSSSTTSGLEVDRIQFVNLRFVSFSCWASTPAAAAAAAAAAASSPIAHKSLRYIIRCSVRVSLSKTLTWNIYTYTHTHILIYIWQAFVAYKNIMLIRRYPPIHTNTHSVFIVVVIIITTSARSLNLSTTMFANVSSVYVCAHAHIHLDCGFFTHKIVWRLRYCVMTWCRFVETPPKI